MLKITTQAEFDTLRDNTPTNQAVYIYPRTDGEAYQLSDIWRLRSNTYIKGIGYPKIFVSGDFANFTRYWIGIIMAGEEAVLHTNITIKGIHLIGDTNIKNTYMNGIFGYNIGRSFNTSLEGEDYYNNSTVGGSNINLYGLFVDDCIIEGFYAGMVTEKADNTLLTNNIIRNCSENGIFSKFTKTTSFTNNKIYNVKYGITFEDSKGIIIQNNNLSHISNDVITLLRSHSSNIMNNYIANSPEIAILLAANCHKNNIIGNTITNGVNNYSIALYSDTFSNVINGNKIVNGAQAIYLHNTGKSYTAVTTNIIGNSVYGIYSLNASNNAYVANSVVRNGDGIYFAETNHSISYGNICLNDDFDYYIESGTNNEMSNTYNK